MRDPTSGGDQNRRMLRAKSLLGRPIGQLALVKGYAYACSNLGKSTDRSMLIRKLDCVDWNITAEMWKGLLVKPDGRVMYGIRTANLASKFIAHMIGANLTKTDTEKILTFIHGHKSSNRRSLPRRIVLKD